MNRRIVFLELRKLREIFALFIDIVTRPSLAGLGGDDTPKALKKTTTKTV